MIIALLISRMKMKLFKCIMMTGHRGAGKSGEKVVFLRARSSNEAMYKAARFPGVKKGRRLMFGGSLLSLEMIA